MSADSVSRSHVVLSGMGSATRTLLLVVLVTAAGTSPAFPGDLGNRAGGGPDAFGYRFVDSAEAGGPVFGFIDISTTGTPVEWIANDPDWGYLPYDEGRARVDLQRPFTIYGTSVSSLTMFTNGYLTTDPSDQEPITPVPPRPIPPGRASASTRCTLIWR
jgi:hypothetical protein